MFFQSRTMFPAKSIKVRLYSGLADVLKRQQVRISTKELGSRTQLLRGLRIKFQEDCYAG